MARLSLNISIASLGKGHHIECKDLEEMVEAEDTVRLQCMNVTRYLEIASTFNGSEVLIDYENGKELVHIAPATAPLLAYTPAASETETPLLSAASSGPAFEMGRDVGRLSNGALRKWLDFEQGLVARAATTGWVLPAIQVRIAAGFAGLLVLIILYEIF